MRLLVLSESRDRVGGVEAYVEALLPALAARYEVAFCSVNTDLAAHARLPSVATTRGPIAVPEGVAVLSIDRAAADPLHQVRVWKPELVFAHGLDDARLEREALAIAPAVAVQHTYHGTCISSAKTMTWPSVQGCERALGTGCLALYFPRRCGGLNPLTMARLYRTQMERLQTLREIPAIVTLSKHMADDLIRNGINPLRVHVVPPFVPAGDRRANQGDRSITRSADTPISLLYLGRLERLKGVDRLIDALPIVARQLNRSLRLVIAGDGAERAALEMAAARIGAAHPRIRIHFAGWQSEAGRNRYLADADALVVPSLWPEPFGLVGLEAAAAGVPAVAFASGGIPEWLRDNETGCLAPAAGASPSNLARAIVRCVSDDVRRARLSDGARRSAMRWTRELHVQRLHDLFARVVPPIAVSQAS